MALILDLAVVALAVVVVGSLALLAWTLGVSSVRSAHRGRRSVAAARQTITDAEARVVDAAAGAGASLAGLERLHRRVRAPGAEPSNASHGERPDA